MRKYFYNYLNTSFQANDKICILLGDIGVFSFQKSFQYDNSRIYNLGIMEQTMIGISCGLSKSGFFIKCTKLPYPVLSAGSIYLP